MTQYTHVHPEFRAVVQLADSERIHFLDQPRWIGYPAAQKILDTLLHLMQMPARPRMRNLLIVGDSNNGKTTIVRRFMALHGEGYVNEEGDAVKPVILTESPPTSGEKGLYIAILDQFWAPYRESDSVTKLRYQVVHMFRSCSVRMLIIDEFHSLLTGSAIKQRETMNALKFLCNTLAIPVVGVGTADAVLVLHTDPQHASRFDVMPLNTWQPNAEFQKLVKGFESVLPLREPSGLYRPHLAQLLHSISGGNTGDLQRLLLECATDAIKSGKEHIDQSIIESKSWLRPTRGIRELI
ncbi:hypothetical protein SAMN04490202_2802 [Pseudomonas reinekei]|uniref:AAA family ATPase n=1 Tax=Pseudomonas reinekei TaxID=395598 RepID=A0A1H0PRV0_PSERE|nr:TniB family NTP-binding protein [Pseudomonas reinekei]KAB0486471.1 AAA family ATPase [Pseudomonas reinekei]OLU03826.1 transposase [Pseudomonas reinekei]SDP07714.1 hypothetical protein SAMN04490202_2802 [Pseudomonas reinekei]